MLAAFLHSLRDAGRVTVPPPGSLSAAEVGEAGAVLRAMDEDARAEAPGEAPAFDADTASWGALTLFRACQAFVHRELDAAQVSALLSEPPPPAEPASAAWSADLALRWLPDLFGLAGGVAPDDPLVARLRELARAWPLSSVGVRGLQDVPPGAAASHPSLRRIYVDRILERRDFARLGDPVVAEEARIALGAQAGLSPEAARELGGSVGGKPAGGREAGPA